MVNGKEVPVHPAAKGVIVYVTVPFVTPVAFNVCAIVVPHELEQGVAPDAPDWVTFQVNVAPITVEESVIFVIVPLHISNEAVEADTSGLGLTTNT